MSHLRELYQELIIDHGRYPRNFGALPDATCHQEGFNPVCGDHIILHVKEMDGMLTTIRFEGSGCAISMASASLLTECLQNKTVAEAEAIFAAFYQLITKGVPSDIVGKLSALGGVAEFPARVKCATLAWHTLKAALNHEKQTVSTE